MPSKKKILIIAGPNGGHHVPDDVVIHRFHAGLRNFERIYRGLVGQWALYGSSRQAPILLERGTNYG